MNLSALGEIPSVEFLEFFYTTLCLRQSGCGSMVEPVECAPRRQYCLIAVEHQLRERAELQRLTVVGGYRNQRYQLVVPNIDGP